MSIRVLGGIYAFRQGAWGTQCAGKFGQRDHDDHGHGHHFGFDNFHGGSIRALLFKHTGSLDFHDAKISRNGGNTIVQIGDDRIELTGVMPHELSKFDFLFDA
jgi:hypothetical protein